MRVMTYDEFKQENKQPTLEFDREIDNTVLKIIENVRNNRDDALFHYAEKFDNIKLADLIVSEKEINEAYNLVTDEFKKAITEATKNITEFHDAQKEKSWFFDRNDNIMLGQKVTPIDKVGVYVPGGKAAYPSTVLMNIIPAKIAGVKTINMTTPPQEDGSINPHVLVAAKLAGAHTIFKMGGAQAIAAFAYGTETVEKVDKIVGPGNAFVARAKKWVYGDVGIDMIAGPSEILVVADETAPTNFVAADLLSQAEHDEQATSICVTTSKRVAEQVKEEVANQLQQLDRYDIASESIKMNGRIIIADTLNEAFEIVNEIAPEHLQLMIENATDYLSKVKHAGAIFLGNYSPEPLGDYLAGPNHTLPTSGTARFASPLGVYDFMKKSSIIRYSNEALQQNANHIMTIANMEGLTGHAKSIELRKNK